MGTFKAPCKIGPIETIVEFHGMDITPNYNLLLGRAWLHPIRAIPFSLHQKVMIPWKGGIAVVLGDVEILALVCGLGEGGCELQLSGFEFMNMADYELKDERYTSDLVPYYSHEVIVMMKNIGNMPGTRKKGRRVAEFPNFKIQLTKEGLGFFEGCDKIKKNLGTLNGKFVKEGGDFLYYGFPEL